MSSARAVKLFSPPGLDPVPDGGMGDEDAVVPPQVPGGSPAGQAVLGDQADGHALHAPRVEALGQGQVREVDGEAATAAEAALSGEGDDQVNRAVGTRIAQVVQRARCHGRTARPASAARAAAGGKVATAPLDARLGKILDTGNPLGGIRDVLAWYQH